jgi:DNA-binding transcriptional ArsR family regulator
LQDYRPLPRRRHGYRGGLLDPSASPCLSTETFRALLTFPWIASPNEIATEIEEPVSNVSYHVRVLLDCEFIELVRTEPRRGSTEHYYRATKRAMLSDELVRSLSPEIQNGIAVKILNETIEDVRTSLEDGCFEAREERHLSWTPLIFDEAGWQGLAALLAETLERAMELQSEAAERLAESKGEESITATMALLGFESARGKDAE